MPIIKQFFQSISWLFKIRKIIINSKISFLSRKWADTVQEIANDFTIFANNEVKNCKSQKLSEITDKINEINCKTHKLWEEMKTHLKIK